MFCVFVVTMSKGKMELGLEESNLISHGLEKPNILKKRVTSTIMEPVLQEGSQLKNGDFFNVRLVSRKGNVYTCLMCTGHETVEGEAKAIIVHMRQVCSYIFFCIILILRWHRYTLCPKFNLNCGALENRQR